jgi:hypothetical protein
LETTTPDLRVFWSILPAPERVEVEDDSQLRLALALHREGVNVSSPYLGFFAFWSVLDAVFDGKRNDVDAFVNREAARENATMETYIRQLIPTYSPQDESSDVATYLREHGRNAIGHVIRHREDRPHITPDDPTARARLAAEAWWLRAASRSAVLGRWPNGVTVVDRG